MYRFLSMRGVVSTRHAAAVAFAVVSVSLTGCTALTAGQLVQAGYDAAKTSLTAPMSGEQAKHAKLVMNSLSVGQPLDPVLASLAVPPKEKSGNVQGFVCYQYAGVYSATEDAVIMAKDGKIVFFGSSTCRAEMQAANFAPGGKYADVGTVEPGGASPAPSAEPAASASSPASPSSPASAAPESAPSPASAPASPPASGDAGAAGPASTPPSAGTAAPASASDSAAPTQH